MIDKKPLFILGTRPEIIKTYPLINQLEADVLFTGQHFNKSMSNYFFDLIKISEIHKIDISYKNTSHNKITDSIKDQILKINPLNVIVQGDTNSTLYGAVAAKYLNKKLYYMESGQRSYDLSQVEEYNRYIVSQIADVNFCNHQNNVDSLLKEGIDKNKIHLTGSTVYASLSGILNDIDMNFKPSEPYILVTLHRPENTDNLKKLFDILGKLNNLECKINFIIHPRVDTKDINTKINKFNNVNIIKPTNYKNFIEYVIGSKFIISDSGGVQEEAAILNKVLIIPRKYTERPELLKSYNFLAKNTTELIQLANKALNNKLLVESSKLLYGKSDVINKMEQIILSRN